MPDGRTEIPVAPNEPLVTTEVTAPLSAQLPVAPNEPLRRIEFAVNGALILDEDPLKIGLNHFAALQNLRYSDVGIEGVQGYTAITTVALANPLLRSGIQFIRRINGAPQSHILAQVATGQVYLQTTAPPTAGNFAASPLFTDSTGAGLGRFALAPDGTVIYCNGVDTNIWGSAEYRCAAFVNYDDPAAAFRYDATARIQNILTDAPNRIQLTRDAASDIWILIGSTLPIQGIRFYVGTANAGASTSTVEYWDGSAWVAVAGFADGTAVGGATLAQTGTMSFTSTVSTAKVQFLDDRLLYYYRVRAGATGTPDATITITHCTVDTPMQKLVDLWDGAPRTPIFATARGFDYTLEVQQADASDATATIQGVARLGTLATTDNLTLGFEERMTALKFRFFDNQVNSTVATVITVSYWNGTAWTTVGTVTDGTIIAGRSLARSGAISWNAPAGTSEFEQTLQGIRGFFYRLTWSVNLPGDVDVDVITGVPAQRFNVDSPIVGYRFPMLYQNQVFLCGRQSGNEGNRIDYSLPNSPVVFNGELSSALGQELYVGDQEDLTAGVEYVNRGNTGEVRQIGLLLKQRQTWALTGNTPEDYRLFPLSVSLGCPCPLTLAVGEVSNLANPQDSRVVVMWLSHAGPIMFEGATPLPMRFTQRDGAISSIQPYFNPNDDRYITTSALERARGWWDAAWQEYNVLLPTAGATSCNVWLVCDLRRQKWYEKVPATYPQMAVPVLDANGAQYIYAGLDSGLLMRLENGNTWDGTAITHQFDSADLLLTGSAWDTVRVRYIKLVLLRETGNAATMTMAVNTDGAGTFTTLTTLALTGGTGRWRKVTTPVNVQGWSHQFRGTVSTNDKDKAPRLIGWALLYDVIRTELT